jgi:uncharacterized protein YyaL (SSP411 family)
MVQRPKMRSPRFGATILVVGLLAVVGVGLRQLRPLIPASSPNKLADETGEYLHQGAYQRIDWLPMSPTVFTEARRLDRPILLAIGTPWSSIGRAVDSAAFSDPDVQMLLKRSFLCVRVDACREPNWINAYLPFRRVEMGIVPDFQIWFLDPTGKPFDVIYVPSPFDIPSVDSLMSRLLETKDKLRRIRAQVPGDMPSDPGHRADVEILNVVDPGARPSFGSYDESLAKAMPPTFGGFPNWSDYENGLPYQRLPATPLKYLLATGRLVEFAQAVDPALRSATVDRLDGGFFLRSCSFDWAEPEYDKVAVQNAELMQVFAAAEAQTGRRAYGDAARDTFDCLADRFVVNGFVAACRVGDELRGDRSLHSSFPPRVLREALSGISVPDGRGGRTDAYSWAQDRLRLRVEGNPRMLVQYQDLDLPTKEPEALSIVLRALRKSASERPAQYAGPALSEVHGTVVARMLWCARLWNDPKRLAVASALFDKLGDFVMGDDVAHGMYISRPGCAYLGDYLAYSDAALQHYLATGRAESFESGLKVLRRARELFRDRSPGRWNMVSKTIQGAVLIDGPEVVDNVGESCTARVIRLLNAYGRLLRDASEKAEPAETSEATSMVEEAYSAVGLFASIAADMGPAAAGYYAASLSVLDETHAFVVGPDCLAQARELTRLAPFRLVSCCFGRVRRDLGHREPGVYVVRNNGVTGPMSVEQAAAIIGRPLRVLP